MSSPSSQYREVLLKEYPFVAQFDDKKFNEFIAWAKNIQNQYYREQFGFPSGVFVKRIGYELFFKDEDIAAMYMLKFC